VHGELTRASAGCTGVLLPEGTASTAERFSSLLHHYSVTHLLAVPSLLRYIAGLPRATSTLSSLKHVISSGDVLTSSTARAVLNVLPAGAALWNVYGCTETAADAMFCRVARGAPCLLFGWHVQTTVACMFAA
jgi:acyl-coenzyme A synthetase/AMP-(fatty) acid ligase